MAKYAGKRRNVCAGQLFEPWGELDFKVYKDDKEISIAELEEQGICSIQAFGGKILRGMLFNVNEDGLTNDLIYTTPTHYPIIGIDPKIEVKNKLVINHFVELEELLKYLGYKEDLTQWDYRRIFSMLVTHHGWLDNHMKLFGWQKLNCGYGYSGEKGILPMDIYENLSRISTSGRSVPDKEEPGYSRIKKISLF